MAEVHLARIYDETPGPRILVDRLWPRGVSKERANLTLWAKDVAPSHELRQAVHADMPFEVFSDAYKEELAAHPDAVAEIFQHDSVTLLTAAKEPANSHLAVLLEFWLATQAS